MGIPFHEVRTWSAAEITLYQCYYRMAPWGEERADIRNAMQMAQTANMHRSKDTKAFEVSDFMPFSEKPEPPESNEPAGLRAFFTSLTKKK